MIIDKLFEINQSHKKESFLLLIVLNKLKYLQKNSIIEGLFDLISFLNQLRNMSHVR